MSALERSTSNVQLLTFKAAPLAGQGIGEGYVAGVHAALGVRHIAGCRKCPPGVSTDGIVIRVENIPGESRAQPELLTVISFNACAPANHRLRAISKSRLMHSSGNPRRFLMISVLETASRALVRNTSVAQPVRNTCYDLVIHQVAVLCQIPWSG